MERVKMKELITKCCQQVEHVDGEVIEIGVYRGESAKLLCQLMPQRTVHLFDTFEGMPQPGTFDKIKKGLFGDTSVEILQSELSDSDNYVIYAGMFPDTATVIEDVQFCFAHVDCDIYESVFSSCLFCYPRMNEGGIILFDDYGACPGAKVAVDEFFEDKPEELEHVGYRTFIVKQGDGA